MHLMYCNALYMCILALIMQSMFSLHNAWILLIVTYASTNRLAKVTTWKLGLHHILINPC